MMRNNLKLFFIVLLFGCVFSQTQIKSVEVTVYSASYSAGINQGLIDAIGMVNGRSLESESIMKNSESIFTTNEDEKYFGSQEFQNQIKEKTKGIVQGYEVLSSSKNSDGLFVINMNVSITKFKLSKSAQRKRMAVMDLRYKSGCCSVGNKSYNGSTVSDELGSAISTYLVQSRKFTVLDRKYQNQVSNEKQLLSSGNVPTSELAKIGQELLADYILVGTINNLNIIEKEKKLVSTNRTIKSIVGNASISYRIVDVVTGQVKFAETFNKRIDSSIKPTDSTNDAFSKAVVNTANLIGVKVLEAIYPFIVERISGDELLIGVGGDIVRVGDTYNLIQYGDKIIDSYTKESLGREERVIGTVEITNVTSKMSYAKIINSKIEDLSSKFKPKTFIIRAMSTSAKKSDSRKKQEEKRKKLDNEFDSSW